MIIIFLKKVISYLQKNTTLNVVTVAKVDVVIVHGGKKKEIRNQ